MNEKIIRNNQEAFLKKYGVSLQERWDSLSREKKADALTRVNRMNEKLQADRLVFDRDNLLRFIIGFSGQLCFEKVFNNSLPTVKIMFWEPDETVFEAYCTFKDISSFLLDERLEVVIGRDLIRLEDMLGLIIQEHNVFHIKALISGESVSDNDISIFSEMINRIIGEVKVAGYARKKFHKLPSMNFLYALYTLDNNYVISQLYDAIPDRNIPVIIVAAGPSLMKNCNELRNAKDRALIIAVSHAAKTLASFGIEPDLVAISDAGSNTFLDHDKERKYTLLSSIWADRYCTKEYNGKVIYHGFNMAGDLFRTSRIETEPDVEMDTGSVATDVFVLFQIAGFKRIILVGQDLAYDEQGYSHTGKEREKVLSPKGGDCPVTEGLYGGKVRTREDWDHFRRFYEKRIKLNPGVDVIDATEGGALIHGTRIMKLSSVIEQYCRIKYPVDKWIGELKKGDEQEKQDIDKWFDNQLNILRNITSELEEIIGLNKAVRKSWGNEEQWSNDFRFACEKYDRLYENILNEDKSDLLKLYSMKDIQFYVENALSLEGDDNIMKRMEMEYNLFTSMRDKAYEMVDYILEIINE